jgi:hypothetical protein
MSISRLDGEQTRRPRGMAKEVSRVQQTGPAMDDVEIILSPSTLADCFRVKISQYRLLTPVDDHVVAV